MSPTSRLKDILGLCLTAGALTLSLQGLADAGVVVLNSGQVFLGKIVEDTAETVVLRDPYLREGERENDQPRGKMDFEKLDIRWYSSKDAGPTDAYWERFHDTERWPIDSYWMSSLKAWELRVKDTTREELLPFRPKVFSPGQRDLEPVPVLGDGFQVQKPEGWTARAEEGITSFLADLLGEQGVRPRIHVFSTPSLEKVQALDQVKWIEEVVARLADETFEIKEKQALHPQGGGFNQEMLTRTVRTGRPILALRKISFRRDKTYFFTAYAHERDYPQLELVFRASMRSMQVFEDEERAGNVKKEGAPEKKGGQAE